MAIATLVGFLAKSVGVDLAKKIVSRLGSKSTTDDKVERVKELIVAGSTAIEAFEKVFGADFGNAVSAAMSTGNADWSYEAATAEYIRLESEHGASKPAIVASLRDELNINLDRIARTLGKTGKVTANQFLGVFRIWMARYQDLLPGSKETEEAFATIESLLDGQQRTFRDVFRLLKKTVFGVGGAMMILSAALIATSTGVGVFAALYIWLFGVPLFQIAALAVSGVALVSVALMDFTVFNAMSASVGVAYKMLDLQMARADERSKLKGQQ